jgi:hypothetical protein
MTDTLFDKREHEDGSVSWTGIESGFTIIASHASIQIGSGVTKATAAENRDLPYVLDQVVKVQRELASKRRNAQPAAMRKMQVPAVGVSGDAKLPE